MLPRYRSPSWQEILGLLLAVLCLLGQARGQEAASTPDPLSVPGLAQLASRLPPADLALLEEHEKTKLLPAAPQQRVITVLDSAQLGNEFVANSQPRFLLVRLNIANLTPDPVSIKRETLQLDFEGAMYPAVAAPDSLKNRPLHVGQQFLPIQNLPMPAELTVASGMRRGLWLLFTNLPPGNHVPPMLLKGRLGDREQTWDLTAGERDFLKVKVEKTGPRQALGVIHIAGTLNTINVGTLAEELDRFAADRIVRVVIDWEPDSAFSDLQLLHWLQNAAMNAGRAQQFPEQQFPGLPTSFRELHLSRLPSQNANQISSYPSNFVPVTAAVAAQRIHKTAAEAMVAALRSAYEWLPRDEVLQAIRTGSPTERAAALAGGAGRLPADKLPLILRYTADPDPLTQQAAVFALSNFGEPPAIARLVALSGEGSSETASIAIAGLAGSRYEAAHAALLQLLDRAPPEARKLVVRTMAAIPRPLWSNALYKYAADPQSGFRSEALHALVQVGHPKLVPLLADVLHGTDAALQTQVFGILASRSDRQSEELAVEFTLNHLKSKPPAPGMLALLNRVKDRRALPLLLARFGEIPNKGELIQTLTRIGDEQTSGFLLERYPDLAHHEKAEVLRYLLRIDPLRFRQLAPQALASGDNGLISQAVQGLQEDGSAEAIGMLTDALEAGTTPFVWQYVANALAALGTSECRLALRKMRDGGKPDRRQVAVNALIMLRQRSPGFPFFQLGQQQSATNNHKDAIEQYDMALQLDPELSDAYAARGHALLALERYAEAGKDFNRAYEQDPFNSMALTGVCLSLILNEGKVEQALRKLEADREKFQNSNLFHYNAACVFGRAFEALQKSPPGETRDKQLQEVRQAGLADLKKSLETGFEDLDLMKKDPDLKLFLELPEFQELIKSSPDPAKQPNAQNQKRGLQALPGRPIPVKAF